MIPEKLFIKSHMSNDLPPPPLHMLLHEHRSISVSGLLLQVSVRILPAAQHHNNTMMVGYLQKFVVALLAKKLTLFMESKRVLPYSQKHATEHYLDSAGCSPLRSPFVSHPRGLHGPKFQKYPARPKDHLYRPNPKHVTRTRLKPDFLLLQRELNSISLQSALTFVSLIRVSLNVWTPIMLKESI
jgi:hypothetical protein